MPRHQQSSDHVHGSKKPSDTNNDHNVPMSATPAAHLRQEATRNLFNLPAQLLQLRVSSSWERSTEQSVREYQLLDSAVHCAEILKVLNFRDRAESKAKASEGRKEEASALLDVMRYTTYLTEMQKNRNDMLELTQRGCQTHCAEDTSSVVPPTAIKVQTKFSDRQWPFDFLDYHMHDLPVSLDEVCMKARNERYQYCLGEETDGADAASQSSGGDGQETKEERRGTSQRVGALESSNGRSVSKG